MARMPRQDGGGAVLAGEVDHQAFEGGYGDVAQLAGRFVEHLNALFDGEEQVLDRIVEDGDSEMLEELGATCRSGRGGR